MKRIVNGKEVECSPEEAAEIQAQWDANLVEAEAKKIDDAKNNRKEQLRQEKLDSLLLLEFAEIDAAATELDIKAIKLK